MKIEAGFADPWATVFEKLTCNLDPTRHVRVAHCRSEPITWRSSPPHRRIRHKLFSVVWLILGPISKAGQGETTSRNRTVRRQAQLRKNVRILLHCPAKTITSMWHTNLITPVVGATIRSLSEISRLSMSFVIVTSSARSGLETFQFVHADADQERRINRSDSNRQHESCGLTDMI